MLQDNEDPVTILKEGVPIIEKQNLDSDIYILGEGPIYQNKEKITVNKNIDDDINNSLLKDGHFEEIDKSRVTAKKFKNRIFLGTDGNYYKSKKK